MSKAAEFWNKEYQRASHLKLSGKPSRELLEFEKFVTKDAGKDFLPTAHVLDVGCGNGRHLLHLAETYGVTGVGFDIAKEAVAVAQNLAAEAELEGIEFSVCPLAGELPGEDGAYDLVVDHMVSHVLKKDEREQYLAELARVIPYRGWYFMKTFLRDGDKNAQEMIVEHGKKTGEEGSYIHPKFGHYEYVWTENGLREWLDPVFDIRFVKKSHGHRRWGKRRWVVVYGERK